MNKPFPNRLRNRPVLALGALLALVALWTWGLGSVQLLDWDEINFAEISREMYRSGNYLQPTIDYLPFHEKPPLFAWLQLVAYQLFGVSEFSARIPNILCGVVALSVLAVVGRKYGLGYWWSAFMGLSLLPGLYFRSGIIDPWFNLFILLALLRIFKERRLCGADIMISAGFLGFALLTKGPAAGLIVGLVCLVLLIQSGWKRIGPYLLVGSLSLIPAAIWVYFLWQSDDGYFARAFLEYQIRLFSQEDAGHGGFPGYHVVVLLLGCFPASVFALPALFGRKSFATPMDRGMRVLFWVVLILFSIVNTKIVHYSSLCYFPLAWFAARWVATRSPANLFPRRLLLGLRSVWVLYALVTLIAALLVFFLPAVLPQITDQELVARLQLPVDWPWYTVLPFLVALSVLLIDTIRRAHIRQRAMLHLVGTLLFSLVTIAIFLPRIQHYTQGAAVSFYQDLAREEVYFGTAYYRSYAPLFYGRVTRVQGGHERQWKFHEAIDRPLYFSSPLRRTEQVLREVPDSELLYQRGGFSFYRRMPTRLPTNTVE